MGRRKQKQETEKSKALKKSLKAFLALNSKQTFK